VRLFAPAARRAGGSATGNGRLSARTWRGTACSAPATSTRATQRARDLAPLTRARFAGDALEISVGGRVIARAASSCKASVFMPSQAVDVDAFSRSESRVGDDTINQIRGDSP
jgi:hypothetical protein